MGSGFAKKKKEAKRMQEQFMHMQETLKNETVEGISGNGLVTVQLTGEYEMKRISIKPECIDRDDIEGLESLIQVAYNDAVKKLEKNMSQLNPGISTMFPR